MLRANLQIYFIGTSSAGSWCAQRGSESNYKGAYLVEEPSASPQLMQSHPIHLSQLTFHFSSEMVPRLITSSFHLCTWVLCCLGRVLPGIICITSPTGILTRGIDRGWNARVQTLPQKVFRYLSFFFYACLFCVLVGHRDMKANIPRIDVGKGNPGYIGFTETLLSPHPVSENANCSRSIGVIIPRLEPFCFSCSGHFC